MIDSFKIDRLFGTTSVHIPFQKEGIKILIGENGLGKTTVLNILYYALAKNFRRLLQYDFESIELTFSSGDKALIKHDDLTALTNETNQPIPRSVIDYVLSNLNEVDLNDLAQSIHDNHLTRDNLTRHPLLRRLLLPSRYPPSILWVALCKITGGSFSKKLTKFRDIVDKNINNVNILYFPTYRRIEEDLKNLNIDIDEDNIKNPSEKLIQFGMDDVKKRFKNIKDSIQKLSSVGLSRISSEILSQLVKGAPMIDQSQLELMNAESIQIILARVGDLLSKEDKDKIVETIKNKKLKEEDTFLVYFIQKLIEIYEQQKSVDNKIKSFVKVCNEYLSFSHKKLIYNESDVEFSIESRSFKTKPLIEFLGKLSSGEKQIISLFSKIYLSEESEYFIVLFDEPELSLSVYWQERLLPDIIKSGQIKNLLAATHSPFIYDNELRQHANGLSEYSIFSSKE